MNPKQAKISAIRNLGLAYKQLSDLALTDPACKQAADMVFDARNIVMDKSVYGNNPWPAAEREKVARSMEAF